jgi:hypothetical protein
MRRSRALMENKQQSEAGGAIVTGTDNTGSHYEVSHQYHYCGESGDGSHYSSSRRSQSARQEVILKQG